MRRVEEEDSATPSPLIAQLWVEGQLGELGGLGGGAGHSLILSFPPLVPLRVHSPPGTFLLSNLSVLSNSDLGWGTGDDRGRRALVASLALSRRWSRGGHLGADCEGALHFSDLSLPFSGT